MKKIDYVKFARKLERKTGEYIHPNQIKRYIDKHSELRNQQDEIIFKKLLKRFWNEIQDKV